MRMWNTE